MSDQYIAVSPGYWGRGATIEEAKATLKKFGGNLNKVVVSELPVGAVGAFVDDLGTIRWTWAEDYDGPRIVDLPVVYSRGVK